MNKIKIANFKKPDYTSVYIKYRMYSVSLGNGITEYFTTEKNVKRYLAITNRNINYKLSEINYLMNFVYQEYRSKFGFIQITDIERITDLLKSIENNFYKLITTSTSPNANHFIYNYFSSLCENMIEILDIIEKTAKYDKTYTEVNRTVFLKENIIRIKTNVFNFKPYENDLDNEEI